MCIRDSLAAATRLVAANAELRAVTPDGDVVGAYAAAGGSGKAPSYIEVQAAVDEARQARTEAEHQVAHLQEQLDTVLAEVADAKERLAEAAAAKREAEGQRNVVARRLAELGAAAKSNRAEADRLALARDTAEQARDEGLAGLAELEERLRLAEATPIDEEPDADERDQLAAALPQARQNEMEVRLAVRTAEERVAALAGRADSLARQAAAERAARERAIARREARTRGAAIARAVALGADAALTRVAVSITMAATTRDAIASARSTREAEMSEVRTTGRRLGGELERLTSEVHRLSLIHI